MGSARRMLSLNQGNAEAAIFRGLRSAAQENTPIVRPAHLWNNQYKYFEQAAGNTNAHHIQMSRSRELIPFKN